MTVARFLAGIHPLSGEAGVWMSKAGIDVRSTLSPDNFLLMPSRKFEQIVLAGEVYLPVGSSIFDIYYGATLTKFPYIFIQPSTSPSVIYYPHDFNINLPAYANHVNRTLTVSLALWNNRISVQNISDTYGLYLQYFVLHRSITG